MDPFVVVLFGKIVFRIRAIRHSLSPQWDEKMLFYACRYETTFKVQFMVCDWDKPSSNDHVCDASFDVAQPLADASKKDPTAGLYGASGRSFVGRRAERNAFPTTTRGSTRVPPVTPVFLGGMKSQQSARNLDKLDFSGVSNG